MKRFRTACLILLLAGAFGAATTPVAHAAVAVAVGGSVGGPVGVDFFYNHLSPYGHWAQRPSYGWVWMPGSVNAGWHPYSAGHWLYTDYGWTWAAADSEPWGWATYHYGRWYDDPDYGWSWVPGYDWGPSWVSWQQGGGYLGWAPLPPAVGWNAGVGLELGGFNLSVGISPASYCFVPERSFLAANVGGYILPGSRNVAIFHSTTNITNYGVVDHRMFNRSLQVANVERFTGQHVNQYRVASMNQVNRGARISGNTVAMFHPAIERRANVPSPRQVAPRSVVNSPAEAHRAVLAHAGAPAAERRAGALGDHRAAPAATARQNEARQATLNRERATSANRERVAASRQHAAAAGSQQRQAQLNREHQQAASRAHQATVSRDQHQAALGHQQHQTAVSHRRSPAVSHPQHSAPPATESRRAPAGAGSQHHASPPPAQHRAPQPAAQHHQAPPQQHAQAARSTPPAAHPNNAGHPNGGGEHHQGGRG